MSLEDDFHNALSRLRHFYADSLKAQSFDGPSISHTKPGAVEFRVQTYPDVAEWTHRWRSTRSDGERRAVVEEIEAEYRNLSLSPSKKYLHWEGTMEKKVAIAREQGTSAHVARLYGVGASTVRKYRKQFGSR